ncbi:MAG: carbonic anhydrase [Phycisphaerae bacterium]
MSVSPPPPPPNQPPTSVTASGSTVPNVVPLARFTSVERFNEERIHALAMYCSDGRWGEAFDEFCQQGLGLPRYDRFAVPGGPAWLIQLENHHPELYYVTRTQLDFLVQVHGLERVVLITHYGCAFYGQQLQAGPEACLPNQCADLKQAAAILTRWYRNLRVEAYLALRRDGVVTFHPWEI